MKQRATAIVIAATMVAAGLSVAPAATAGHTDCHGSDFDLATSESNAAVRNLDPDEEVIALAQVDAGSPEDLFIELLDEPRELDWEVYMKDGTSCVLFDSGEITDSTAQNEVRSVLDDPLTGTEKYWIHYLNDGTQSFDFQTWSET